ncbi:uncharacterized protein I303_100750 [Kwoniella dejecticola CBS 10117]|uniref:Uncharacterized protein n=1 Tax=Kwoniella dejecticola CBS 10117 TaxID=1296121 RepID=A0A1A6AFV7_9TREE|nr:uncharacterized protein I303_00752 [Kwoniella dejecticola CBS 10117]OBR88934.1 hypothetical protein I303_00752 [Kwoniella dejecticola CBS 10117]
MTDLSSPTKETPKPNPHSHSHSHAHSHAHPRYPRPPSASPWRRALSLVAVPSLHRTASPFSPGSATGSKENKDTNTDKDKHLRDFMDSALSSHPDSDPAPAPMPTSTAALPLPETINPIPFASFPPPPPPRNMERSSSQPFSIGTNTSMIAHYPNSSTTSLDHLNLNDPEGANDSNDSESDYEMYQMSIDSSLPMTDADFISAREADSQAASPQTGGTRTSSSDFKDSHSQAQTQTQVKKSAEKGKEKQKEKEEGKSRVREWYNDYFHRANTSTPSPDSTDVPPQSPGLASRYVPTPPPVPHNSLANENDIDINIETDSNRGTGVVGSDNSTRSTGSNEPACFPTIPRRNGNQPSTDPPESTNSETPLPRIRGPSIAPFLPLPPSPPPLSPRMRSPSLPFPPFLPFPYLPRTASPLLNGPGPFSTSSHLPPSPSFPWSLPGLVEPSTPIGPSGPNSIPFTGPPSPSQYTFNPAFPLSPIFSPPISPTVFGSPHVLPAFPPRLIPCISARSQGMLSPDTSASGTGPASTAATATASASAPPAIPQNVPHVIWLPIPPGIGIPPPPIPGFSHARPIGIPISITQPSSIDQVAELAPASITPPERHAAVANQALPFSSVGPLPMNPLPPLPSADPRAAREEDAADPDEPFPRPRSVAASTTAPVPADLDAADRDLFDFTVPYIPPPRPHDNGALRAAYDHDPERSEQTTHAASMGRGASASSPPGHVNTITETSTNSKSNWKHKFKMPDISIIHSDHNPSTSRNSRRYFKRGSTSNVAVPGSSVMSASPCPSPALCLSPTSPPPRCLSPTSPFSESVHSGTSDTTISTSTTTSTSTSTAATVRRSGWQPKTSIVWDEIHNDPQGDLILALPLSQGDGDMRWRIQIDRFKADSELLKHLSASPIKNKHLSLTLPRLPSTATATTTTTSSKAPGMITTFLNTLVMHDESFVDRLILPEDIESFLILSDYFITPHISRKIIRHLDTFGTPHAWPLFVIASKRGDVDLGKICLRNMARATWCPLNDLFCVNSDEVRDIKSEWLLELFKSRFKRVGHGLFEEVEWNRVAKGFDPSELG